MKQLMPTSPDCGEPASCPFCDVHDRIVIAGELWVAVADAFPVNPGHTLVVPRRHVESLSGVTPDELRHLPEMVRAVVRHLDDDLSPDGYNIGVNDGLAAGQTVFHVHVHVIPRFEGDDPDPRGGVRKVKAPVVPYLGDG